MFKESVFTDITLLKSDFKNPSDWDYLLNELNLPIDDGIDEIRISTNQVEY